MSQEENKVSKNSKFIKKTKFTVDPEAEARFNDLKRKYANAVAYLLVKNVTRMNLREYFDKSEENRRRFDTIKRFRQAIIDSRPKAKLWVDKPFYTKLDIGEPVVGDEGVSVSILLGECVFRQKTQAVSNKKELELYMETIAKIIDAEKVWADPDMADFDIGEREYLGDKTVQEKIDPSLSV